MNKDDNKKNQNAERNKALLFCYGFLWVDFKFALISLGGGCIAHPTHVDPNSFYLKTNVCRYQIDGYPFNINFVVIEVLYELYKIKASDFFCKGP